MGLGSIDRKASPERLPHFLFQGYLQEIIMKTCSKCKVSKNESEFSKNKSRKYGLQHRCKICSKGYRDSHKQEAREYRKRYNKINNSCRVEYNKRWNKNHPGHQEKYREEHPFILLWSYLKAWHKAYGCRDWVAVKENSSFIVYYAVHAGFLIRPRIYSICGKPSNKTINGHHEDYMHPFRVIWCCEKCHAKLDKAKRLRENIKG